MARARNEGSLPARAANVSRCGYCGTRLSAARVRAGSATCGGVCADAEKRLRELYGLPTADDAERELRRLERELRRQAGA